MTIRKAYLLSLEQVWEIHINLWVGEERTSLVSVFAHLVYFLVQQLVLCEWFGVRIRFVC